MQTNQPDVEMRRVVRLKRAVICSGSERRGESGREEEVILGRGEERRMRKDDRSSDK